MNLTRGRPSLILTDLEISGSHIVHDISSHDHLLNGHQTHMHVNLKSAYNSTPILHKRSWCHSVDVQAEQAYTSNYLS